MAQTPSNMLPLGTPAPEFNLPDPAGSMHSIDDFSSARALLVVFMCNHCPFVKNIREELAAFAREYSDAGLAIVAINSNDFKQYPDDSPEMMAREVEKFGYPFPYLVDETQDVARAYQAACTPDFFLFDQDRRLVYRGRFDDSTPSNGLPVTGRNLRDAVSSVLAGEPVSSDQRPSIGCNIKWKRGNEPQSSGLRAT